MNGYLFLAGCLTVILAIVHSALGELLIFRHLRHSPCFTLAEGPLKKRHLNTLWSTWHLISIFGLGFAAILMWLAQSDVAQDKSVGILLIIGVSFLISAAFWLWGTKGKHPAWFVLLAIAILTMSSAGSI